MSEPRDKSPVVAPGSPAPLLNPQQKESLLMLIVINYAEQHDLLNAEQLEDARASLRSLFLRATGEETMLRKVIGILRVNRALNKTFSEMAVILDGIRKSQQALANKHNALKHQLDKMSITPDENRQFVGPLLEYSADFIRAVTDFDRQMTSYKDAREQEARSAHIFRLAHEARERLKHRFESGAGGDNHQEEQVKKKVIQSFNYSEAEADYQYNQRSANSTRLEIESSLKDFHQMCQMAMKPEMRSPDQIRTESGRPPIVDVYSVCVRAMETFPRLRSLVPVIQDLLRLYQSSFGMFKLDFDKFNRAMGPMVDNTEDYFHAKEQDEDVRTKQQKLAMIEALIAYIEDVAPLLQNGQDYTYAKFSQTISGHITRSGSKWSAIAEQLLQMKVTAEAELSTRLA
jgi:hypothetical protein